MKRNKNKNRRKYSKWKNRSHRIEYSARTHCPPLSFRKAIKIKMISMLAIEGLVQNEPTLFLFKIAHSRAFSHRLDSIRTFNGRRRRFQRIIFKNSVRRFCKTHDQSMPANVPPITRNDQNCCLINLTHRAQLFACHIFMNYFRRRRRSKKEIKFMRMWNRLYNFLWRAKAAGRRTNTPIHGMCVCVNMERQR